MTSFPDELRQDSPTRLLVRHFLRRLLDNDLIAPHADRHETLTVGATMLISTGFFVSVIIASKYVMNPFPTPVHMGLGAIQDRFLFVSASMILMALVAAAQWDALSIDARDAAILGPLPIGRGAIVLAKLAALVIFAAAFSLILNVGPAVLFPLFFAAQLPISFVDIILLLVAHLVVTVLAGGFGVASVVALREVTRAMLGRRLFERVSTALQALLVVAGVTALLVLPGLSTRIVRTTVERASVEREWVPPLWFIGLHESLVGHVITNVKGRWVPLTIRLREQRAVELYERNEPQFRMLAATALLALGAVGGLALAAFAWNNRRLPFGQPSRAPRRRLWRRLGATALERWIVRASTAQAGFFFTMQVLPRSPAHRVAVATSVAAALASLVVAFSGIAFGRLEGTAPLGVWAAQTFVLAAMLGGVRHAVRVPADLRASGPFLIAWPGDDRRYLSGVKRAVLMSVVVPAIVLLLPLHVVLLGWSTGLLHALCGFALATVLLEALFYGIGHPPFICAYVPAGSFKRAMPIYFAGVVVGCSLIAGIERAAISHRHGSAILLATLAVVALALGWGDRRGRQTPVDVEIDLAPDPAVQRFDLSG